MYTNWKTTENEDRLRNAVNRNKSIASVLRELGLKDRGGNVRTIRYHITRLGLDTSHHTGQSWNRANFKEPSQLYKNSSLRSYLLREHGELCWSCGLDTWMGMPIPLELDHIDGNNSNNELSNLRILCCNCHAQTPTFRNKKRNKESSPTGEIRQTHAAQTRAPLTAACQFKSGVGHTLCIVCFEPCSPHKYWHSKCNLCIDCERSCSNLRCRTCNNRLPKSTKITWPSSEELQNLVRLHGFEGTGRMLGIGGNSVRKHLQATGLDPKSLTPFNNGRGRVHG